MSPRLRQAVVKADDLDATVAALRETFGLAAPFADPGVALFGLRNAVFAVGDAFVEVVSPVTPDAAAARRPDGGYMAIFQVEDLDAARARAREAGVRDVWSIDLDDIAATHFHPADCGGAIVSVDRPVPASSWRWGGPSWEPGPGALRGIEVSVSDPDTTAARWATLVGGEVPQTTFLRGNDGITAIDLGLDGEVVVGTCRVGAAR